MTEVLTAAVMIVIANWFFRSPLCGATADALRKWSSSRAGNVPSSKIEEGIERLEDQLGALREEVTDLAERVDFTERMLAEVRRRDPLPVPGRDR